MSKRQRRAAASRAASALGVVALGAALGACSFDYSGMGDDEASGSPDLVMSDVEYVRVRSGRPELRLQAEELKRWDADKRMVATRSSFAQYGGDGAESALGSAASASFNLDSGDASLSGGVSLSVKNQKIAVEAERLDWNDKDHVLSAPSDAPVLVKKEDGSYFSGNGFRTDARKRTWAFSSSVAGVYVSEDDKKPAEGAAPADEAAAGDGASALPASAEAEAAPVPAPEPDGVPPPTAGAEPAPSAEAGDAAAAAPDTETPGAASRGAVE